MKEHFFSALSHMWWMLVVYVGTVQIHNGLVELGRAIVSAAKINYDAVKMRLDRKG